MNRDTYWDDAFLDYWLKVTSDSNEGVRNTVPSDDAIAAVVKRAIHGADKSAKLLDLGCSFCRLYSFIKDDCDYYGSDISEEAIIRSKETFPEIKDKLFVCPAERMPFKKGEFDYVVCVGVFDACYQEAALFEALRVLKTSGVLLVTGKNYNYEFDDDEAFVAEVNARKKENPNYFTTTKYMIEQLEDNNCEVRSLFFKRRGDFAKLAYTEEMPDKFYEYACVITKKGDIERAFLPFAGFCSQTFSDRVVIKL